MWDPGGVKARMQDGTVVGCDVAGSGLPLLLIHGGATDSSAWTLVRALLPAGMSVAAMDRRGRGTSGRGDKHHSLEVEADDVLGLAAALGGEVVVAAHSIGATIALQALRRSNGLIIAALLYEPPLPGMTPPAPAAMIEALDEGRDEDALESFLRDMVGLSTDEIRTYRSSPIWAKRVSLIWTMRREAEALASLPQDLSRYSTIEVPVQLVLGSQTAPHHTDAIRALQRVLPAADTTLLNGQGHGALLQAPDLVASAITDLLGRIN